MLHAVISLSSDEVRVPVKDGKELNEVLKEKEDSDQVEGGKVNVKEMADYPSEQNISDRLIDPLDGGEENYRPRTANRRGIRDSIRIRPTSHTATNNFDR